MLCNSGVKLVDFLPLLEEATADIGLATVLLIPGDGWMDGWLRKLRCAGEEGWKEGGSSLWCPVPPTPCADSREGKARGRH